MSVTCLGHRKYSVNECTRKARIVLQIVLAMFPGRRRQTVGSVPSASKIFVSRKCPRRSLTMKTVRIRPITRLVEE
jgi:hypothetical protein